MKADWAILDGTEKLSFVLRALYRDCGFERYRMSKFEEYDLYSRNKEFLVSENLITFTDLKGHLKALKPDVTLSIIKNNRDPEAGVRKLCYDEKVYRAKNGEFREIPQSGVECFGDVTEESIGEVLTLAAKSLALAGKRYVLSVSDLDILTGFLGNAASSPEAKDKLTAFISSRNMSGLKEAALEAGLTEQEAEKLTALVSLEGPAEKTLPALKALAGDNAALLAGIERLERIVGAVPEAERAALELDFSVTGNTTYYNGVIFKGFVEDVPERVLSGGQYDGLMKKLGRNSKAVGFAVYLDTLERIEAPEAEGGAE